MRVKIGDMQTRARNTVHDLPSPDQQIAATVKALMAAQDLTMADVGPQIGLTKSTFHRRLTGGGFLASDVMRLAMLFGIPVGDLYDGLGGRIKCAARDLNPEPGGYRTLWGLAA